MKELLFIAVIGAIAALAWGCRRQSSTPGYPRIVADSAHSAMGEVTNPIPYRVPPCQGLVFDPSGYSLPDPAALGVPGPNVIQVFVGSSHQYVSEWLGAKTIHTLDSSTLLPAGHAKRFGGFHAGETVGLAIGHYDPKTENLSLMWLSTLEVTGAEQPDAEVQSEGAPSD